MIPIFDGHNDSLTKLYSFKDPLESFFRRNKKGHFDLQRSKDGGLFGANFSIFVPAPKSSKESKPFYGMKLTEEGYIKKLASPIDINYAKDYTFSVLEFLNKLEQKADGKIKKIKQYNDLITCLNNDKLAILLHFEGAEVIDKDLDNLEFYYEKGLRSLGLVWSRPNIFGTGVPFEFPNTPDIGPGLSKEGKKLVKECNRLGILIDLAHINEKGFWDVAELSDFPLIVSHTGVHSICRSTRNLIDKQINAIGDTNGIIGIMFGPSNIRIDGKPNKKTPISTIIDHIEYIVQKIGIDHVGLGSDFDGTTMPNQMEDVTKLPMLMDLLKDHGYKKKSVEKIGYKNWLRVIKETWKQ